MSVFEFLAWLLQSGGVVLVVSWLADRVPAYQALTPDAKSIVFKVAVVVLALSVRALQIYVPQDVWVQIDPWFKLAAGVVVLASGASVNHALTKLSAKK